ncbi:MAG: transcriptional regulator [Syntrophales bacterium]|nr:transcriptional regulator [Syntrophales bacterium]MDD5641275.1 transcriptional regulator [Syntrophales bacterium]
MTGKHKKPSRLMQAVLETAKDMQQAGILTDEAYGKITMRHLGVKDKSKLEQLTGEDICAIREQANMSQVVFAHYLNVTVGYVS